ncbi:MAG: hypothetical protein U0457_03910 [Candidatus Sericytochromatia bacterium]
MRKIKLISLFLITGLFSCDVKLVAGNDKFGYINSTPEDSSFNQIGGMDIDSKGNLFISDTKNNVIRKIDLDGKVSTYAGTGKAGFKDGKKEEAEFYYNLA